MPAHSHICTCTSISPQLQVLQKRKRNENEQKYIPLYVHSFKIIYLFICSIMCINIRFMLVQCVFFFHHSYNIIAHNVVVFIAMLFCVTRSGRASVTVYSREILVYIIFKHFHMQVNKFIPNIASFQFSQNGYSFFFFVFFIFLLLLLFCLVSTHHITVE